MEDAPLASIKYEMIFEESVQNLLNKWHFEPPLRITSNAMMSCWVNPSISRKGFSTIITLPQSPKPLVQWLL